MTTTPYSVTITSAILNWRRFIRISIAVLALYLIARYLLSSESAHVSQLFGIMGLVAVVAFVAGTPYITLTIAVDAVSDATADVTSITPEQFLNVVDAIQYSARRQIQTSPTCTNYAQVQMTLTPHLLREVYVTRTATLMIPIVYVETSLPEMHDEDTSND